MPWSFRLFENLNQIFTIYNIYRILHLSHIITFPIFQAGWIMLYKIHPTALKIIKWTVLAASIISAAYAINKVVQMREAKKQRQQVRTLLSQTVAALKNRLPSPNSPNLADKMPQNISPYLLNRVLYYPRLNAYKYTFRPRYQYDSSGTPTGLDRLNEVFDSVPDWLERRSIWFKAENGRWRCLGLS